MRNQIDHIAINRKWVASLKDVRTKRGADVGSDHMMVEAKFQLSLRRKPKIIKRRFDIAQLKNSQVSLQFMLNVSTIWKHLRMPKV